MCNCKQQPDVVNITNHYTAFSAPLIRLAAANWVILMQYPDCQQCYTVDEWDKYRAGYAVKIPCQQNWQSVDRDSQIKAYLVKHNGGFGSETCVWMGCAAKQVNGSAYCIEHLYDAD